MTSRANQQPPPANGHHNQHQQQQQQHRPYVPPPPPRNHHHHRNQYIGSSSYSSSSASLKGCCCCLFLLLIFLALLAVAVTLVIVLAIRPRKPNFDLNQVSVQYLLVTPSSSTSATTTTTTTTTPTTTTTSAYLSLNISLLFTADNPNKVGIKYSESVFYVMYRGVPLGVAVVPGFDQPAHSRRLVQSHFSVDRVDVMQGDALQLVRDATENDRVDLRITGDVAAKIRFLGFSSPRVQVSVDCAIAISPRRQSLTYKQCGVDGLNV